MCTHIIRCLCPRKKEKKSVCACSLLGCFVVVRGKLFAMTCVIFPIFQFKWIRKAALVEAAQKSVFISVFTVSVISLNTSLFIKLQFSTLSLD